MAYKCKTCGYKFKKSDSDLCPECFTARDDIDCGFFEKKHTHFKDSYNESNDFLSEQLREERKSGFADENYSRNDFGRNMYGSGSGGNSQSAYSRPTYNSGTINSSYNGGKSTLRFTSTYTPGQNPGGYRTGPNSFYNSNTANKSPKTNRVGCLIAVIVLLMFVIPIVVSIVGVVAGFLSGNFDDGSDSYEKEFDPSFGYSANTDDGRITAYVDTAVLGESYSTLSEAQMKNESVLISSYTEDETFDAESDWKIVYLDVYIYSGDDSVIKSIAMVGTDDDGEILFSSSPMFDEDNLSTYCYHVPFLICEETENYKLQISCEDAEDSYTATIIIDAKYSQLVEMAAENEEYSYDIPDTEDLYDTENLYDYDLSDYDTSLKDSEGKNVQLGCTDYKIYPGLSESELLAGDEIAMYDSNLEDSDWIYANFELIKADSSKKPLECKYNFAIITGLDPNEEQSYVFSSYGTNRILLNKEIKLYYVHIAYYNELGETEECDMVFNYEEFFESQER